MDHKLKKNVLSEADRSSAEKNFKSLYSLTPVVEDAIKSSIKKKNKQNL